MQRIIGSIFFLFALCFGLSAQNAPPAGMYPLMLTGKSLPVGTKVWANIGDSQCAYPHTSNYPRVDKKCFEDSYFKAKIIDVYVLHDGKNGGRVYYYKVEFDKLPGDTSDDGFRLTRNSYLDDGYKFYNLPDQWASYSQYFVLLNW